MDGDDVADAPRWTAAAGEAEVAAQREDRDRRDVAGEQRDKPLTAKSMAQILEAFPNGFVVRGPYKVLDQMGDVGSVEFRQRPDGSWEPTGRQFFSPPLRLARPPESEYATADLLRFDPMYDTPTVGFPIDEPMVRRTCRVCGCTNDNCEQCVEKTGSPCFWVDRDLCSACVMGDTPLERALTQPIDSAGGVALWALRRWPRAACWVHDRTQPTKPR